MPHPPLPNNPFRRWMLLVQNICITYFILMFAGCDSTDDQHINFIGKAGTAQWFNDIPQALTFPGSSQDSKGFAKITEAKMEDGLNYNLLLLTHPRWASKGAIEGHFRLTIPKDCSFRAVVGFIDGAVTTDGVIYQVLWKKDDQPPNNPPITALQGELFKQYDHSLASFIVDLRGIAGQTGEFILRVKAGESSGQDWAVWQTAIIAPFAENADIDKDGLDDQQESQLLQRFTPFYKYSVESINSHPVQEEYRPTDAIWYIRHCDLLFGGDQNSHVVFNKDQMNADPGLAINAQMNGRDYSDIISSPKKTSFRLNIYDDYRSGFFNGDGHDWPEILNKKNIGLYGHVVPTADNDILKIEYWQFFGYNQANAFGVDERNHEADWISVQMLFSISKDNITSVSYTHHGDITTLAVPSERDPFVLQDGDNIHMFWRGTGDEISFFMNPGSPKLSHPVVYVEWGGHEFWPNPSGSVSFAPNHNGNGDFFYLTQDVPNLGEVENPMNGIFAVIMQYNGRWGAWNQHNENPPGIELHTEWLWPGGSPIQKAIPPGDFEK